MEILPKLEWCCVEIPVGQNTYRSILTPTQIKNEIYSDLEIGDSVNVDDKQGENNLVMARPIFVWSSVPKIVQQTFRNTYCFE